MVKIIVHLLPLPAKKIPPLDKISDPPALVGEIWLISRYIKNCFSLF